MWILGDTKDTESKETLNILSSFYFYRNLVYSHPTLQQNHYFQFNQVLANIKVNF